MPFDSGLSFGVKRKRFLVLLIRLLAINTDIGVNIGEFLQLILAKSSARYGFDSDEYKNGEEQLIRFYKMIGFRVVKDSIMVLNRKDD